MSLTALLEWWNFIFALPLMVAIVLAIGLAVTGVMDELGAHAHESDSASHDADTHDAHGAETHHEDVSDHAEDVSEHATEGHEATDADHHGESSHEASHAAKPHADDHSDSIVLKTLHLFGIGMGVPLTVLLPMLMLVWGVVGLGVNTLLQPLLKLPVLFVPVSITASLFGMALCGRTTGILMRRLGLVNSEPALRRANLIGCSGRAVFEITETTGVANIRSPTGDILRVSCQTLPGQPSIPAGTPVLVIRYNEESGDYIVEPHPFDTNLPETHRQESTERRQTHVGGRTDT